MVVDAADNEIQAPPSDDHIKVISTASRPTSFRQGLAIRMEKLLWSSRAESWEVDGSAQLAPVVEAVLESCEVRPGMVAVDLGCGSGQVTLPLARRGSFVLAVDLSAGAIELLKKRATEQGLANVHALTQPIEGFDLAPQSVDLVVSNYALHHLRDSDKAEVVRMSYEWLRPGGQLVLGDMMMGRGASPEDRAIILTNVRAFARRGPAGWWRIVKNGWRFALRLQEKPLPAKTWAAIARSAGFEQVSAVPVIAEAWVMSAKKPGSGQDRSRRSASTNRASVGQASAAL